MDVNKHVAFNADQCPDLIHYLNCNNIPYQSGEIITSFDILESNYHWLTLYEYVKKENLVCLSEAVFTDHEIDNAEWLTVRSEWLFGYPQPEANLGYEQYTYTKEHHCPFCGNGLIQQDSFRIKKEPKWGRRHFTMLNWVEDELFVDGITKAIFERSCEWNLSFRDVKNKQGTIVFSNIFQLNIPILQHRCFIEDQSAISETLTCSNCNTKKYHPNGMGMLRFNRDSLDDSSHMVKTLELFGWGKAASRMILISQDMRRFIVSNHLEQGLIFEPIELLS